MRKVDIISALVIGEVSALMILLIFKNISLSFAKIAMLPIVLPILALIGLQIAYFIGKKVLIIWQAAKFGLVGILNTLIDLGVLNLLILISGTATGIVYSGFKGISFTVAVINSYFWNKFWTFKKSASAGAGKEFVQFIIVSIIGFGINVLIASVVVNGIGAKFGISDKLWANVGAATATLVAMAWNFIGYKFIVFKEK